MYRGRRAPFVVEIAGDYFVSEAHVDLIMAPASRRDFAVGFDLFLETVARRWNDIERFVIATRIKASIAACHSGAVCSAFGSFVM